MSDLTFKTASQLAQRVRDREIGCLELLDAYLDHADPFNPQVNAIAVLHADRGVRPRKSRSTRIGVDHFSQQLVSRECVSSMPVG